MSFLGGFWLSDLSPYELYFAASLHVDWMKNMWIFTLLGAGYICITINCLEICSG